MPSNLPIKDKGAISVMVSSKKLDDPSHEIYFSVKDTGIGIPEDKMGRLFQIVHPNGLIDHTQTWRRRTRSSHIQEACGTDGWKDLG